METKQELIIQNEIIRKFVKEEYTLQDIYNLKRLLITENTFVFPRLPNFLFPAAIIDKSTKYTGYQHVWVRDNIFIALSHYINGDKNTAINNVVSIMRYFSKYKYRFEDIINRKINKTKINKRPNIRFNGVKLSEIKKKKWSQAQNDALGYFLWFYCKLVNEGSIIPTLDDIEMLFLFPSYFKTIEFWKDEDNGHWEEEPKIESSSIGTVVAGLRLLLFLIQNVNNGQKYFDGDINEKEGLIVELIEKGLTALNQILPFECITVENNKRRDYDSALLFLIYPLNVITEKNSDLIIENIENHLKGKYGIKRFLGDTFWPPDSKKNVDFKLRTSDYSQNKDIRDKFFQKDKEAQWCLFDPIMSIIFGNKFLINKQINDLNKQIHYFNRSLGQITGNDFRVSFKCPELYYLEDGKYVPNDATPLLWTQANLLIAFKKMEECLESAL